MGLNCREYSPFERLAGAIALDHYVRLLGNLAEHDLWRAASATAEQRTARECPTYKCSSLHTPLLSFGTSRYVMGLARGVREARRFWAAIKISKEGKRQRQNVNAIVRVQAKPKQILEQFSLRSREMLICSLQFAFGWS